MQLEICWQSVQISKFEFQRKQLCSNPHISSLVSSLMWWLSLARDLITSVHVCTYCTETIQHNSPSSVIQLLTSIQNSFIRNFQQQAKLRIHRMSLFGVNPKKRCIKFAYVLELSISLGQSINSWQEKFNTESRNTPVLRQLPAETKYGMTTANCQLHVKPHFPDAVPTALQEYLPTHLSISSESENTALTKTNVIFKTLPDMAPKTST